jgi:hypothetical protein
MLGDHSPTQRRGCADHSFAKLESRDEEIMCVALSLARSRHQ